MNVLHRHSLTYIIFYFFLKLVKKQEDIATKEKERCAALKKHLFTKEPLRDLCGLVHLLTTLNLHQRNQDGYLISMECLFHTRINKILKSEEKKFLLLILSLTFRTG